MRRALAGMIGPCAMAVTVGPAAAEELWAVRAGTVVFHLNVSLLHDLGVDLSVEAPVFEHDDGILIEPPAWMFPIRKDSDFRFLTEGRAVRGRGVEGSVLRLVGSITVVDRQSRRRDRLTDLAIVQVGEAPPSQPDRPPAALQLRSGTGLVLCELANSMFDFRGTPTLSIHYLNARIAEPWARSIGRPDLAG